MKYIILNKYKIFNFYKKLTLKNLKYIKLTLLDINVKKFCFFDNIKYY